MNSIQQLSLHQYKNLITLMKARKSMKYHISSDLMRSSKSYRWRQQYESKVLHNFEVT